MGSRIFAAAILGDVGAVAAELRSVGDEEVLLSKGSVKGLTVMHLAAMHGHTDLVKWLVHNHPRAQYVTECEPHGRTPLHLAALNGKLDVVVELLKLTGVDPMCMDHYMHTPLLLAVLNGHISVINELLNRPNDQQLQQVNAANRHGHNALHLAVRHAHVNIVQFLLKRFEAKQAIDQLFREDNFGWTAVHSAAAMARADILEEIFMCWNPPDLTHINNTVWSPLHVASWLGHAEIVKLMCGKMGLHVNMTTQNLERLTPLHMAANNGHDAVVDVLLRQEELRVGDCDALRRTAFHYAARQGHASVVSRLLAFSKSNSTGRPLSINASDVNGLTALHLACRGGHEEVVHILLREGADVNAKTESVLVSKSLLDIVLSSSNPPIIDPMLLEADCCCISQMTPLHLAAKNGHMAVVRQLLNRPEINIRVLDGHGLMPQDWAEVREIKKEFLDCLEQASRSTYETSASPVPKQTVQVLREELMKWEKLMVAVMPPSTFHSFQSVQYITELSCEDLDRMGMCSGNKQDAKASNSLEIENTSTPSNGDLDTAPERILEEINEITAQEQHSGNTPLHVAVKRGHKKAVELLLKSSPQLDDAINAENSEGLTPLALAFKGNHVEICQLILQNSETVKDDVHDMLKTAISRKWLDMGVILVGDARTGTGDGIDANLLDEALHSEEKRFVHVLLRRTTIKERLLQERREHLNNAAATLVIAALIASVTYQGVLQPPEGKHHMAHVIFEWLNAIAFYSAVASTIAVVTGSLPIRHIYELINARDPMRMSRKISCVLLTTSSACVVWAYAAAGFSRALDKKPFASGNGVGAIATTCFLIGFLKQYTELYKPFCRRSCRRSNGQHNEGWLTRVAEIVKKITTSTFFRQEKDGLKDDLLAERCPPVAGAV